MGVNGSPAYRTGNAFRRSLQDRLKLAAKERGRAVNELRREFVFQRFLALVFTHGADQWVLKGGAGLLVRLPAARYSKDLDLLHRDPIAPDEAVSQLRAIITAHRDDHLRFVVTGGTVYKSANLLEVKVDSYIGASIFESFSIDLALDLQLVSAVERIKPRPVVELQGLPELPEVVLYPLSDQIADKVCAMYETHGPTQTPSSRYRDLVDLVLIVSSSEIDAATTLRALASESTRRSLDLPEAMEPPAPSWTAGYTAYAQRTAVADEFHSLPAALDYVGTCLSPLLSGDLHQGRWDPKYGWES